MEEKTSKLDQLTRNQETKPAATLRLSSLFPALLFVGFFALLALVLGDRVLPAQDVTVSSVVTLTAEMPAPADPPSEETAPSTESSSTGEMLFQASGWIEPSPLPVKATSLVDGVIESVHVLEGDSVVRGQLLAKLVDADAKLDLETAESQRNALEAKIAAHRKKVLAARARAAELADPVKRLSALSNSNVSDAEVEAAKLRLATQVAEVATLEAQQAELEAELAEAATAINRATLALQRTEITAPIDGRVLRLYALPGLKRMLGMDDPESATIATLFDPANLQARIDIPLDDASRVSIGQPVRLRTNFLPDAIFQGTVTRIAGEADLQRNTLQVKVTLADPDARLRPEMLCRAEFFARTKANEANDPRSGSPLGVSGSDRERIEIYAPEAALINQSSPTPRVWKLNPEGSRVVESQVTTTSSIREGYQQISSGLQPGDQVVLNPPSGLREGARVRVIAHQ